MSPQVEIFQKLAYSCNQLITMTKLCQLKDPSGYVVRLTLDSGNKAFILEVGPDEFNLCGYAHTTPVYRTKKDADRAADYILDNISQVNEVEVVNVALALEEQLVKQKENLKSIQTMIENAR